MITIKTKYNITNEKRDTIIYQTGIDYFSNSDCRVFQFFSFIWVGFSKACLLSSLITLLSVRVHFATSLSDMILCAHGLLTKKNDQNELSQTKIALIESSIN